MYWLNILLEILLGQLWNILSCPLIQDFNFPL